VSPHAPPAPTWNRHCWFIAVTDRAGCPRARPCVATAMHSINAIESAYFTDHSQHGLHDSSLVRCICISTKVVLGSVLCASDSFSRFLALYNFVCMYVICMCDAIQPNPSADPTKPNPLLVEKIWTQPDITQYN